MNAMVNVPLSDIDDLRNQLKGQTLRADTLQKTEKQVKLTIIRRDPYAMTSYTSGYKSGDTGHRGFNRYNKIESKDEVINVSFEGFSEIEEILRREAEEKVADKIFKLQEEIKSKAESYSKHHDQLQEEHKKNLDLKDKEIAILKGELIDEDLQETLVKTQEKLDIITNAYQNSCESFTNLNARYEKLISRNFFQRLFNIGL